MKITGMTFVAYNKAYIVTSEAYHNVYGSEMMVADCKGEKSKFQVVFKKSNWNEARGCFEPNLNSATLMLWCNIKLQSKI